MLQMKTALCGVLKNFILEPIDNPDTITFAVDIALRSANNKIMVKFVKRR